jgi:hypothetical protein
MPTETDSPESHSRAFEHIIMASYTREERHALGVLASGLTPEEALTQDQWRRWWGRKLSGRGPHPMEPDDAEDR